MQDETSLQSAGNILIVDDTPENLQLLFQLLKERGYKVRPVSCSTLALDVARKARPDLILLDINMPELDGFELCRLFKADPALKEIPVIFISAMSDSLDKVKAFGVGGVDYITKPFQTDEVEARVKTHVTLYQQQRVERELLENTLNGSFKLLTEILFATDPQSFARTRRLRELTKIVVEKLSLGNLWEYELSAMLSAIGFVTIPPAVINRAQQGLGLSPFENTLFESVPLMGSRLLANIPRLEAVSLNILYQNKNFDGSGFPDDDICGENIPKVSRIMKILGDFIKMEERKIPASSIFASMCRTTDLYDTSLVEMIAPCLGVRDLAKSQGPFYKYMVVTIDQLMENDILSTNILTSNGVLFINEGTIVTSFLLLKLQNYAELMDVSTSIKVRRARSA